MFDVDVGCMAKIPGFGTEQELREFWDAHDSAEYFEDMSDDEVRIAFKQVGGSGHSSGCSLRPFPRLRCRAHLPAQGGWRVHLHAQAAAGTLCFA